MAEGIMTEVNLIINEDLSFLDTLNVSHRTCVSQNKLSEKRILLFPRIFIQFLYRKKEKK